MFKRKGRLIIAGLALAAIIVVVVVASQGGGVMAEIAVAERTGLSSSVRAEGHTRVMERYLFSAPVSGQLVRIVHQPGDSVRVGDALFRVMPPPDSEQTLRVSQARLTAASAQTARLSGLRDDARAAADQAQRTVERQRILAETDILSPQELEQAELAAASARRQADAADAALRAAMAEEQSARALALTSESDRMASGVVVRAVETGVILRINDRSGRVVAAGEPVMETGNLRQLEVVVDVLSEDAVRIRPGNPVVISGWGEDGYATGTVRYVEPAAFTKWSALGVEEQRVNVVIDADWMGNGGGILAAEQPSEASGTGMGDGYRVDTDIEVWSSPDALTVPVSSVFRESGAWYVFRLAGDIVAKQAIEIGARSSQHVEVVDGLQEGDEVVRFPTVEISDGVVIQR